MAGKWEVTNRELLVFFGVLLIGFFVMAAASLNLFDPITAGVTVITIVAFFTLAQWLESKGVFSHGMGLVFIIFGLGVVMILNGMIYKGYIPLVVTYNASLLAVSLTNALIYGIVIASIIGVALAVYVFYFRKGLPLGAKKKVIE